MKILMTLTSWFPPDSRVEKEAVSLSEAGHEVHILCYSNASQKEFEQTQHFTVHRFPCSDFFVNKLSALALIVPFYFNRWKKEIEKLYSRYSFDVIHVHDLPLSKVGYHFKEKYGCRLVCDQHEFYSDWIKKTAHMNTLQGKLTGLLSDWEKYERKYLTSADLVVTVSEPLRENYIRKYALGDNDIISVPNTPTMKIYNYENINSNITNEYNQYYTLFYAGGIDILRGIDTAIAALAIIRKEIPNIRLLLCGKIVKPYDPFKTAKDYDVEDLFLFKGWIDEKDLPSYIAASNICFFTPPADRDEINKTIATKIYQYAIMNKPVIVSDAQMMKDFVEQNNLGLSIQSDNSEQFAEAVLKIYNEGMHIDFKSSCAHFWEETVEPLCTNYQQLNRVKAETVTVGV